MEHPNDLLYMGIIHFEGCHWLYGAFITYNYEYSHKIAFVSNTEDRY